MKIKNRGTSIANNVVVKGYHCKPSAGVLWPNDLQPMTTAQLSAGTLQPNNTEEKIVGPFEWTPVTNAWGHDCMLMIVWSCRRCWPAADGGSNYETCQQSAHA